MQQLKDIESLSEIDGIAQNDCRLFSAFQFIMANIKLQGVNMAGLGDQYQRNIHLQSLG